jgi:MFS transporter, DHA2 family, multidrug resistance protein
VDLSHPDQRGDAKRCPRAAKHQYFQLVLGYSPLEAGLWSVPGAAAFVVGSQLTPPLAARVRAPVVMLSGIVVAIVGVALLTQVGAAGGAGLLVAGIVILSLGLAPLFTLAADLAVGSAPPERAGAASRLLRRGDEPHQSDERAASPVALATPQPCA